MRESRYFEPVLTENSGVRIFTKDGRSEVARILLLPTGTYMQTAGFIGDILETFDKYVDMAGRRR